MQGCHVAILTALVICSSGCSTQYVSLDNSYKFSKGNTLAGSACQFVLGEVTDARKDKDSLGALGYSHVSDRVTSPAATASAAVVADTATAAPASSSGPESTNMAGPGSTTGKTSATMEWLKHGLHSAGYLDAADASGKRVIPVNINLQLAYIIPSAMAKASNVVLGATFGKDTMAETIRGSSAGINWADSGGEIQSSFNASLDQAIQKLNTMAVAKCGAGS